MMKKTSKAAETCPCGLPLPYKECCGRFIDGGETAPDAERLMRSRYTAYALGREPYLLATWHPDTRRPVGHLQGKLKPKWVGLTVLEHRQQDADHATVAFVARYKLGGMAMNMEETSRFTRLDGRWYYLDGEAGEDG
jgi:SEC-C motif-containing protein